MTPIRFCTIVVHRYLLPAIAPPRPFKGPPRTSIIGFSPAGTPHPPRLSSPPSTLMSRPSSFYQEVTIKKPKYVTVNQQIEVAEKLSKISLFGVCVLSHQIHELLLRVCPGGIHLLERRLELARLLSHRDVLRYHRCRPWKVPNNLVCIKYSTQHCTVSRRCEHFECFVL